VPLVLSTKCPRAVVMSRASVTVRVVLSTSVSLVSTLSETGAPSSSKEFVSSTATGGR